MNLNKIYNEDCLTGMDKIPDSSVDMILTDMPYGITACEWDIMPPLDVLWRQFKRVIKDNGAIVLTSCQPFTTTLINSNPKWFRYCWYWHKSIATGFANSHKMPLRCIEEVCVFYKRLPVYNPQGLIRLDKPALKRRPHKAGGVYGESIEKDTYSYYTNYPRQTLNFKCERGLHPTQKPVTLLEYLLRTYTNPGDVVLDPFSGSATTAVACIHSRRNFIGFEKNQEIYKVGENRLIELSDKQRSEKQGNN